MLGKKKGIIAMGLCALTVMSVLIPTNTTAGTYDYMGQEGDSSHN